VQLDGFVLAEGDVVTSVQEAPGIGTVSAGLSLPGELRRAGGGDDGFETSLDVLPFATAPWAPEVTSGVPPSLEEGILLAEKAAEDLGVGPGGTVLLRHPVREGMSYRMVDSEVRVAGTHPIALRSLVYLDSSQADLFGLDGITNTLQVTPEPGVTADQAQRALFALPGVAAAMPVVDLGDTLRSLLDQFMGVLRVMEGAVLLLALLIAFNSTSVAVDERSREHATMFAFGLPVRTVVRMTVVEAMVVGVLGTLLGVVLGYAVLQYLFHTTLPNTMPDIGFDVYLSPATLTAAALAGVAVVALAPLFTVRKLRRMDVPATLRVVE
jgi:putative ABC transport system permease protein